MRNTLAWDVLPLVISDCETKWYCAYGCSVFLLTYVCKLPVDTFVTLLPSYKFLYLERNETVY